MFFTYKSKCGYEFYENIKMISISNVTSSCKMATESRYFKKTNAISNHIKYVIYAMTSLQTAASISKFINPDVFSDKAQLAFLSLQLIIDNWQMIRMWQDLQILGYENNVARINESQFFSLLIKFKYLQLLNISFCSRYLIK